MQAHSMLRQVLGHKFLENYKMNCECECVCVCVCVSVPFVHANIGGPTARCPSFNTIPDSI
jgi:hypothetical protein